MAPGPIKIVSEDMSPKRLSSVLPCLSPGFSSIPKVAPKILTLPTKQLHMHVCHRPSQLPRPHSSQFPTLVNLQLQRFAHLQHVALFSSKGCSSATCRSLHQVRRSPSPSPSPTSASLVLQQQRLKKLVPA